MLFKNDSDQPLKPDNLVFTLAIAGRLDAQAHLAAQKFHKDRSIYTAYTIVDSLSTSYSMYKYFFDVAIGGDADKMHESMLSPAALVGIGLETCFLVGISFFSYYFAKNKKNPNAIKTLLVKAGPLIRDVTKGMKNGYKGWRSTLIAFTTLSGSNVQFLVVPIGLVFSVLAVLNRLLLKSIDDKLQNKIDNCSALLQEILERPSLSAKERLTFLSRIQANSLDSRANAFILCTTGALFDGLYLYMGVLTLAALPLPILIAMVTICSFYTLCCVFTRLYEEYEKQASLLLTQHQCQLILLSKQLETEYTHLLLLDAKQNKSHADIEEISRLKASLNALINEFESTNLLLEKQMRKSYWAAALAGMKNGLGAYGVLASIVFTVGAFVSLAGVAFPPLVIFTMVLLGLVAMIGFISHALVVHHQRVNAPNNETPSDALITVKPAPTNPNKGWVEVFRSLFSGLGKGQKFSDFVLNPLQEIGSNGHYHDSPVMCAAASVNALLFGSIFGLRALTKEVGQPTSPAGPRDLVSNPAVLERVRDRIQTPDNTPPPLEKTTPRQTASIKLSTSLNSFFKPENPSKTHNRSENNQTFEAAIYAL